MSETKKIISDVGFYSGTILLTQGVTVVAAVLTRRFLGPVQTGVWSFVQVILNYAEYSSLGTVAAVALEIPFYQGKGQLQKMNTIQNTAFTFSFFMSLMVSCGVLLYVFWRKNVLPQELFWALCFTGGLVLLQRLNNFFISILRARKRFGTAGKQMFYSALVNAGLIAVLAFRWRLYGFLWAMVLSLLFNIFYILKHERFELRFFIGQKELWSLVGLGVPLIAIAFLSSFFETIDRVMITKYIGFEALGFYSIALMAYAYINSIPNSVGIVMIPNVQEKYGRTENKSDLKSYLSKSDLFYSGFIPVLIGLGWFLAPFFIQALLPKFTQGVTSLRFLILSGYFVALSQAYSQFIYVVRKHMALLPIFIVSCSIAALLNWITIRQGFGINGVAVATTLAMLCHFTLLNFYASSHIFSFIETVKNYSGVLLKFFFMLGLLWAINRWVKTADPLSTAGLQTTVYLLAYLPFLIEIEKKFSLLSVLRNKLAGR